MKEKKGFNLRTICGENILVEEGEENIDFNSIISMNETAAYLWRKLLGKEFTSKEMVKLLVAEYDVDEQTALADSEKLVSDWQEAGIIED